MPVSLLTITVASQMYHFISPKDQ